MTKTEKQLQADYDKGKISLRELHKALSNIGTARHARDIAKKYNIIAFEKNGNVVKVAMMDPQDVEALNVLRFISQNKHIELELFLIGEDIFQ